jgi:hypothetical protein
MWAKSVFQPRFGLSPIRDSQQSVQTFWQGRSSEVHIVHTHELRVDQAHGRILPKVIMQDALVMLRRWRKT